MRDVARGSSRQVDERNYAKLPLTKKEIGVILDAAGSVAAVLNTRHAISKENGWRDKPPSRSAFIKAAAETPNLLRRPILVRNGKAVVGNDVEGAKKLLK